MSRPPRRLPPELAGLAIRTSEAAIWDVSRSRMRRRDVAHPFHGVSGVELRLDTIRERCAAFQPIMLDGQAFSHVTAAALYGAPLPSWLTDEPLHVSVLFPRTPPPGAVRGRWLPRHPRHRRRPVRRPCRLPRTPPHRAHRATSLRFVPSGRYSSPEATKRHESLGLCVSRRPRRTGARSARARGA
ncbi:hypothetical protein D7I47_11720 [Protaetiibacter intestinalis]|uniref:Uncharacterized protein n=1 Tax=Protaetiibacter intestinalis TaxID=2419774 RepID=A0A387B928_9MICO|nr:hypothetical protein D7I47_11720 [Protaetiibacter intestinalis]